MKVEMRAEDGRTILVRDGVLTQAREIVDNTKAFAKRWVGGVYPEKVAPWIRAEGEYLRDQFGVYTLVVGYDESEDRRIGFKDKDGTVYWEPGAPVGE